MERLNIGSWVKTYVSWYDHDSINLSSWLVIEFVINAEVIQWLNAELMGRWTKSSGVDDNIYFELESDFVLFKLTWI